MTDLSPAAQAVLDACLDENCNLIPSELRIVAAALRAAADQLTPYAVEEIHGAAVSRNKLLSIAAELEAQ